MCGVGPPPPTVGGFRARTQYRIGHAHARICISRPPARPPARPPTRARLLGRRAACRGAEVERGQHSEVVRRLRSGSDAYAQPAPSPGRAIPRGRSALDVWGGRGPTQRRHPAACAFESHEGPRPARQLVPRRIAGARLGRGHGPCRAPRSRCWRVPQPVDGGDARRAAGDMPGPTRRAGAIEGRRERVLPRVPATRAPPASAGCNPRRGSGGRAGQNTAGSEAARGRAEGRGRGLFVRGEGRGVSD
jgi:hypothetical protein